MKKYALRAVLLGILFGGISTPLAAQNYNSCPPDFCNPPCSDGKFTMGADWLFWQAKQDNQPTATVVTDSIGTEAVITANDIHTDFDVKSGYRVYLGYEFPCDQWQLNASYSYFPGRGSTKKVSPVVDTLTSTQFISTDFINSGVNSPSGVSIPVASYESTWNLHLNWFDLDLSRKLCCGECFSLRPHIGFRAVWLNEKLTAFMPLILPAESTFTANGIGILKEKFHGYGVEGGLWANWNLGYGFSFVGHFGGSILYSKFHTYALSQEVDTPIGGEPSTVFISQFSTEYRTGTPTMDYFVGMEYINAMCGWEIEARLGWEQHILFNVNQLLDQGNLYTQGLTLGLAVSF